jgi:hypothetical protein
MKLSGVAVPVVLFLVLAGETAYAYSITTYQGLGGSKTEACALAKESAMSPGRHPAHGRLLKTSGCQCNLNDKAGGGPAQWRCLVQTTRAK